MTQRQYQHDPSKAELKSHITELTRRFIIIHKLAKEDCRDLSHGAVGRQSLSRNRPL